MPKKNKIVKKKVVFITKEKKRNPKRKSNRKKRRTPRIPGTMSECGMQYALAVSKPFDPRSRGACIPIFPSRPSQKVTAFARGVFTAGAGGCGFVAVAPCLSNDSPAIWSTTSAYSGTTINCSVSVPVTGVTVSTMPQNPYVQNYLTSSNPDLFVKGRIISTGIRVRYIGTELNRGGRLVMYVSQDHNNMQGEGINNLSSFTEAIRLPITREWSENVIFASDKDEMEYPDVQDIPSVNGILQSVYPLSNSESVNLVDTSVGAVPMVVMVDSLANNAFEFEIIQHAEYVGKPSSAQQTRTHSDIEAVSRVQNAASSSYLRRADGSSDSPFGSFVSELAQTVYENRVPIGNLINFYYGAPRRRYPRMIRDRSDL